jgi:hypothetical protein
MLTIEMVRRTAWSLPILVRLGLLGLVLAGIGDVAAHLEAAEHAAAGHEHTSEELAAHLGAFVSMVVVFAGVVVDGVRHSRARRGSAGRRREGAA